MKTLKIFITAILLAAIISFLSNGPGAWSNMLFRLNLNDKEVERAAVKASVKQYNINSAGFYNTGGDVLAGLAEIPAGQMLKRRHFKDINMLKEDGFLMVFDRDRVEVTRVYFPRRDIAIAETSEVWAVVLQEFESRKPVFNVKAVEVKARYRFHKETFLKQGLKWIAQNVDVYPFGDDVPELNIKTVL